MAGKPIEVEGQELGFNAFRLYLSDRKEVSIAGPVAVDVRDGALVFVNSDGKAQIAIAPGKWLSVNVPPPA